ncbi:MAG: hypothetical protein V3U24_00340 [Candidatus Neomarinimicrobiota bacterium]
MKMGLKYSKATVLPSSISLALLIGLLTLPALPSVTPAQNLLIKTNTGKEYSNCESYHSDDLTLYISQPSRRLAARTWEIKLVSGQIYARVHLKVPRDDPLHFVTGSYGVTVPLETIREISSVGERDLIARWHYLGGAASFVGGFLTCRFLSSTNFFSPSSPAGPFPPILGGTIATVGLLEQARKLANIDRSIHCDFSGITAQQRIQSARELFGRQIVPFQLGEGKKLVTAIPLMDIDQIHSSAMMKVGIAGLRLPVGPLFGAVGGAVLGGGLEYWIGASSISGCEGVDCVELKNRVVTVSGSLGAVLGYLGARMRNDPTVHNFSRMTPLEKVPQISETMAEENVKDFPDAETVDLVYFGNGSIVKGKTTRGKPGSEDNMLHFSPQDTNKQGESSDFGNLKNELMFELAESSIESRKILDLIGFLGSYAGTIGGYYALGGEDLARIVIPVVGPFLLLEPPQQNTPHTPFPFRQLLLVGSGLVQAGFLGDYIISTWRQKNLRKKYQFGIFPSGNDLHVSVSIAFDL